VNPLAPTHPVVRNVTDELSASGHVDTADTLDQRSPPVPGADTTLHTETRVCTLAGLQANPPTSRTTIGLVGTVMFTPNGGKLPEKVNEDVVGPAFATLNEAALEAANQQRAAYSLVDQQLNSLHDQLVDAPTINLLVTEVDNPIPDLHKNGGGEIELVPDCTPATPGVEGAPGPAAGPAERPLAAAEPLLASSALAPASLPPPPEASASFVDQLAAWLAGLLDGLARLVADVARAAGV
jgi:hypothetical protein